MAKQKTRFIPIDNSVDIINLILDTEYSQPRRGVYSLVRTDTGVVRRERRGEYQVGRVYLLRKRVKQNNQAGETWYSIREGV